METESAVLPICPPKLLSYRERRAKVIPVRHQKISFDAQMCSRTEVAWTQRLAKEKNLFDKLHAAARTSSKQFYVEAQGVLSRFPLKVISCKGGLREAFLIEDRSECLAASQHALRMWLRAQEGQTLDESELDIAGIPALLASDTVAPLYFCCVILHPFLYNLDLTKPLEGNDTGKQRIASAVTNLHSWIETMDSAKLDRLLCQLGDATSQQQVLLLQQRAKVLQELDSWLSSALGGAAQVKTIVPFGSLELGLATTSSDIDIQLCVESSASASLLVTLLAEALNRECPAWLCPGSVVEKPSARAPVISFEINVQVSVDDSHLSKILQSLQLPAPEKPQGRLKVDATFTHDELDIKAMSDTLERDMIQHGSRKAATAVQMFIKYWTKSADVCNAQNGTLSSYAWRTMLFSHLMSAGAVACLRKDFHKVEDPLRMLAVNVWRKQASVDFVHPPATSPAQLLKTFAQALCSCCIKLGEEKHVRLWQVVCPNREVSDAIFEAMKPEQLDGMQAVAFEDVGDGVRKIAAASGLLFLDLDDTLFPTGSRTVASIDFDSPASLPSTVNDHIQAFALEAQEMGYAIVILSGRHECLLGHIRPLTEAGGLRPVLYMLKEQDSQEQTADFKRKAVRGLLSLCRPQGRVCVADDVPANLTAMLDGVASVPCRLVPGDVVSVTKPFVTNSAMECALQLGVQGRIVETTKAGDMLIDFEFLDQLLWIYPKDVPSLERVGSAVPKAFALLARSQPCAGVGLQKYVVSSTHAILLGLSFGGRKGAILHALAERLGAMCLVLHTEGASTYESYWPEFLGTCLKALADPKVKLLLINAVPARPLIPKISQLLGATGKVICVLPQPLSEMSATDVQLQSMACLRNVMHSNGRRRAWRGESGAHVVVGDGLSLWPDDCDYSTWATTVWKGDDGVSKLHERIKKKMKESQDVRKLPRELPVTYMSQEFYRSDNGENAASAAAANKLLAIRKAATEAKHSAQVRSLMDDLRHDRGVIGSALALQRSVDDIVDEIHHKLRPVLGDLSNCDESLYSACNVDPRLVHFIQE